MAKLSSTYPKFSLKFTGLIVVTSFMLLTMGMIASQLNRSQNLGGKAFDTASTYSLSPYPESRLDIDIATASPSAELYVLLHQNITGTLITDQSELHYTWSNDNPSVVTITPFNNCTNGIAAPCPNFHASANQFHPGMALVTVQAIESSSSAVVATTIFTITVTDSSSPEDVTLTYNPNANPICYATPSARLAAGQAPFTYRFEGSAKDNGNGGIQGSEWDFDADGTWDAQTVGKIWIEHTFTGAGTFRPKFRIKGYTNWSEACDAWEQVTVSPAVTVPEYDLNNDSRINLQDYNLMLTQYLNTLTP